MGVPDVPTSVDLAGLDPAALGSVPPRTEDPAHARRLMAEGGAAILTGWFGGKAPDERAATAVARAVLGHATLAIAPPAAIREGGERDKLQIDATASLPLHADGFAYGDRHCDAVFLICVEKGSEDGASFVVDARSLIAALPHDLRAFLTDVPVDLTEPGMHPATSPILLRLASGRTAARCTPWMEPAPAVTGAERERHVALLDRWRQVTWDLTPLVPRFTLEPGDTLCIDNYRMFHGRDPYAGNRFLWRVWAWTSDGNGLPDGVLHSDSRYATVTP